MRAHTRRPVLGRQRKSCSTGPATFEAIAVFRQLTALISSSMKSNIEPSSISVTVVSSISAIARFANVVRPSASMVQTPSRELDDQAVVLFALAQRFLGAHAALDIADVEQQSAYVFVVEVVRPDDLGLLPGTVRRDEGGRATAAAASRRSPSSTRNPRARPPGRRGARGRIRCNPPWHRACNPASSRPPGSRTARFRRCRPRRDRHSTARRSPAPAQPVAPRIHYRTVSDRT